MTLSNSEHNTEEQPVPEEEAELDGDLAAEEAEGDTAPAAAEVEADEVPGKEADGAPEGVDGEPAEADEVAAEEPAEEEPVAEGEAAVEFEGERPIVRDLEYQAPRGKAAAEDDDEAQDQKFTTVAEARAVAEGLLFSSNEPLSVNRLSKLMGNLHPKTVRGLLLELQWEYDNRGGALQIIEIAGGYQMSTRAFIAPWMFRLHKHKRRSALSPATLETLAIIAYRQPITKGEIEAIRGVESGAPLRTLQELNLVEASGRREVVGRPQLYITTEQFLKAFGLKSLADLPSISELKTRFAEETRLKAAAAAPQPEPPPEPELEAELPGEEHQTEAGESDEEELEGLEMETFEEEQNLEVITEAEDLDEPEEPEGEISDLNDASKSDEPVEQEIEDELGEDDNFDDDEEEGDDDEDEDDDDDDEDDEDEDR